MDKRTIEWAAPAIRAMETIKERDEYLEQLWDVFADVPCDLETECIEEEFLGFPAGTHREEIWRWFDSRFSKGVVWLLYCRG